jgi:hypothetical protein
MMSAAGVFLLALVVLASTAQPVQAIVPERSRVELVKVFGCNVRMRTAESCAEDIESRANAWFQEKQPGAHILQRRFHGSEVGVYLVISYEVLDWRAKVQPQKKLSAEAP